MGLWFTSVNEDYIHKPLAERHTFLSVDKDDCIVFLEPNGSHLGKYGYSQRAREGKAKASVASWTATGRYRTLLFGMSTKKVSSEEDSELWGCVKLITWEF